MKNLRYCYKDKERECEEKCEAFFSGTLIMGLSEGGIMTGRCLDLVAKFKLMAEISEIRKILGKKKK